MTTFAIYRKTMPLAFLRMLLSIAGLLIVIALPVAGYFLTRGSENLCLGVTLGALVAALVLCCLISRFAGYMVTAGQVAMITRGLTTNEIPRPVIAAGKEAVKARFATASAYFLLYHTIKGITSQITRGLSAVGAAIGGLGGEDGANVGAALGGAVSAFVAVMLEYVNFCCLGWVFYQGEQNAFKSTCDGAVIYFQNGKTLLKNTFKVIGISSVSLLVIGGALAFLLYALLSAVPALSGLIGQMSLAIEVDAVTGLYITTGVLALICWGFLNAALVKPFILIVVLRSYLDKARVTPLKADLYGQLCGLSKRFRDAWTRSSAIQ